MGSAPACVSSRADGPVPPPASPDCPHPQWARHKDHIVGVTWLKLEAAELDSGSAYEARLRVQMAALEGEVAEEERYEGVWSDWSQPACFPHIATIQEKPCQVQLEKRFPPQLET